MLLVTSGGTFVRFYVNIVTGVLSVVKHYMVAVTRDISPFVAVSSVLLLPQLSYVSMCNVL